MVKLLVIALIALFLSHGNFFLFMLFCTIGEIACAVDAKKPSQPSEKESIPDMSEWDYLPE